MSQQPSTQRSLVAAGSNLPNGTFLPQQTLVWAGNALSRHGWTVVGTSRVYTNPAWPPGLGAPDYVNAVMLVEGPGEPQALLAALHRIEDEAGRVRGTRYMSRTLDLDLLAMGATVLPDEPEVRRRIEARGAARDAAPDRLILPHPRLHERAFVLIPMAEVAPDWRHPILGRTAAELRDELSEQELASLRPI